MLFVHCLSRCISLFPKVPNCSCTHTYLCFLLMKVFSVLPVREACELRFIAETGFLSEGYLFSPWPISAFVCFTPTIIYHLESSHTITHAVVLVYEIKSVLCIYSVANCIVYRTEEKVNHVLLFTVLNPVYPITVVSMSAMWSFTLIISSVSRGTLYIFVTVNVNGFCVHNVLLS